MKTGRRGGDGSFLLCKYCLVALSVFRRTAFGALDVRWQWSLPDFIYQNVDAFLAREFEPSNSASFAATSNGASPISC